MKKFIVFAALVFVVWYWAFRHTNGVQFTLRNVGTETLRSVMVDVGGNSYVLGDIPSKTTKTVKVEPRGESDIKLRFANGPRLTIDCHIENDYGGSIEANVTSRAVVAVMDESRLPSWF
jgi:hypothetical protein